MKLQNSNSVGLTELTELQSNDFYCFGLNYCFFLCVCAYITSILFVCLITKQKERDEESVVTKQQRVGNEGVRKKAK